VRDRRNRVYPAQPDEVENLLPVAVGAPMEKIRLVSFANIARHPAGIGLEMSADNAHCASHRAICIADVRAGTPPAHSMTTSARASGQLHHRSDGVLEDASTGWRP